MDVTDYLEEAIGYAVDSAKNNVLEILLELTADTEFSVLIEQDIAEGINYASGGNDRISNTLWEDYYEEIASEVRTEFIDYLKSKL